MITSIVLKGRYNISVNSNKKIKLGDNIVAIDKDIPFVRYRFESYTEDDFKYINDTMAKMSYSTHLIEVKLDINAAATLGFVTANISNIAKYLYIDITDEDVARGSVSQDILNLFATVQGYKLDRIMLKDKSTTLDTVAAKKIIEVLSKQSGIAKDNFGVCSSPLSFGDWCCLTAVKARELMSVYSVIADVALPTANHQCMNCCGCIRYFVIEEDTPEVADSKDKRAAKTPKEGEEKTEKAAPKKKVQSITFGQFKW